LNKSATNISSECRIANIDPNDAMILPHDANPRPDGIFGKDTGEKPFYPDFIIVRRAGNDFIADVLEPHDDSRLDTWAKVKGLARFADEHGVAFGRLMVGRKFGDALQVVDVADHQTREKARRMGAPADLEALFEKA